jgi:eukaryotic-like serine/threonine-protein kinase
MTRLTFNENSRYPLWTPDGKRLVFVSGDENKRGIYLRAADGTGKDELLGSVPDGMLVPQSWSSDGKNLIAMKQPEAISMISMMRRGGPGISPNSGGAQNSGRSSARGGTVRSVDIGSLSMDGDHKWKPLLQENYAELLPQISPDGRWIAYVSDESEQPEIYVRPFPEVDKGKWQVSIDPGLSSLWPPSGRELFYIVLSNGSIMAVDVETKPTFKAGKSKALFNLRDIGALTGAVFDISPDGKRFLMLKRKLPGAATAASAFPRKINIVLNWFEELKQRVPVN